MTHLCSLNALISRTMMSLSSTPSKTPTWRSSMSRWRWETWDTATSNTNSTWSCSHMSDNQRDKKQVRKEKKNIEETWMAGRVWRSAVEKVTWEKQADCRQDPSDTLKSGKEARAPSDGLVSGCVCVCSPYAAHWPAQPSAAGCWVSCCVETICMHEKKTTSTRVIMRQNVVI